MDKSKQNIRGEQELRTLLTQQVRLGASGEPYQNGKGFEVLAITAGQGNGWLFEESALKESLPLWDGVECFIKIQRK